MASLGLYLRDFREFLSSDEGRQRLAEAEEKKQLMQKALSKENFPKLNEEAFPQLFARLHSVPEEKAARAVETLTSKYGLENLKGELYYFLFGERPIEERFDEIRKAIPDWPTEFVLEMATFAGPREFCMWNNEAKQMIKFVGQSRMHGLSEKAFTKEFSGWDYVACKTALNQIREQLRSYLQRRADFVDVLLFARYMYDNEISKVLKAEAKHG